MFFGALIDAADRGVKVNLLLDGMFHGLDGKFKDVIYTFEGHPNMNIKAYEPLNLLMPWTANNRMHDKYIIADKEVAMIGGRNIGDMYFAPDWYDKKISHDRDVVIINLEEDKSDSAIQEMSDYFTSVWEHEYTKNMVKKLSKRQYNKGIKKGEDLLEMAKEAKEAYKDILDIEIDLKEMSFPTNKISLISNPLERFSKQPFVWYELSELMKNAEESVFIQSPYIVPSNQIIKNYISMDDMDDMDGVEVFMLTNSLASSPNIPAYSGYMNHRKRLVDLGINIYELQSEDSIHAKSYVIDKDLTIIGSFNFDSRSAYLSTETMVVIHSPELVESFAQSTEQFVGQSLLVGSDYKYEENEDLEEMEVSLLKKIIFKTASLFARFFEFML